MVAVPGLYKMANEHNNPISGRGTYHTRQYLASDAKYVATAAPIDCAHHSRCATAAVTDTTHDPCRWEHMACSFEQTKATMQADRETKLVLYKSLNVSRGRNG